MASWTDGRTSGRLFGVVLLASGLVTAGCPGCGPDNGNKDGGEVILPQLSFFSPVNDATLTSADDADPVAPGIQAAVEIRGDSRVPPGTVVTLTVDTDPVQTLEGTLSDGSVRLFPTLAGGAFPDGRINTLSVSAAEMAGDQIQVRVIENTAASCSFEQPAAGATLTTDANAAAPGFQTDVVVACAGTNVAAGGPVRLQVFEGPTATGAPVSTVSVALANGQAAFDAVTLPEGQVTLQASVASSAGGQVGLSAITVRVDTNRCDVRITAPAAQSVLTSTNSTDLEPGTEALDLDFTVQSSQCPAGTLALQVGNETFSGTVSGGNGTVRVALPQGTSQVVATLTPSSGSRMAGESLPVSFTVDTLAPCATLASPAMAAVLTAADDEEMPPNAANGVTVTLSGAVEHPEGASTVHVRLLSGATSVLQADAPIMNGMFSVVAQDLAAGSYSVRLASVDQNGNTCPAVGQPPRQSDFSVSLDAPVVTVAVVNDSMPQDGTLILLEDDNNMDAGMQARVRVSLANADPNTGAARVRLTPVDQNGMPVGDPVEVEGALDAMGSVEVVVSVPDARYRLSVVVAFGDGRDSVSPTSQFVLVDGTPPALAIASPTDGATLSMGVVDVRVTSASADLDVASLSLSVNGSASMVSATAAGMGTFDFASVPLMGAADGRYELIVSARDAAGNPATASAQVTVDDLAPVAVVAGVDVGGTARPLEPQTAGTQARTMLDITTPAGLAALDYDQDASNGLQYAFSVEVPLADCMNLGAVPLAVLDVSGLADQQVVPLTVQGQVCRGVADGGGTGLTLRDGDGEVSATVTDTAGNTGVYTFFYTVVRQPGLVRIDSPEDGARVGAGAVDVVVTTDLSSGTCALEVDGVAGATQPAGPSVTFSGVQLGGTEGASFTLQVACTNAAGTSESLPVTVVKDLSPPVNGALVLGDGTALPAAFNRSIANDGPISGMRYLKDLAVEVDAEAGACARLQPAALTATPEGGSAQMYTGGAWQVIAGTPTRCRSEFALVDLGAANEAGLSTTLEVTVTDTAGNAVTVGPITRLNDQVAPTVSRVRPTATLLGGAADAHTGVAGFQTVVEYTISEDGRATTGTLSCSGTSSACPTDARLVQAGQLVIGDNSADPVTLTTAATGTATVTLTAMDTAGNSAVDTVMLTVDAEAPGLDVVAPLPGARFGVASDASGSDPGMQVLVNAAVTSVPDGTPVMMSVDGGTPVTVCTISGPSCSGRPTIPDGTHTLEISVTDAAGNTSTETVTITVDSVRPTVSGITVTADANMDGFGGRSEDAAAATAGFQSAVTVTVAGVEDGRMLTLLSDFPVAGSVLAGPSAVSGNQVTFSSVTFAEGRHTMTVRVSDLAGNGNDEPASARVFTADLTNPMVAIASPSAATLLAATDGDGNGGTPGYLTDVVVSADVAAGQTCTLQDANSGSTLPGAQASNGTQVVFTGARLGEGARALTATCTDRAGNTGTSAVYQPLVDTLAPRITAVEPNMGSFGSVDDLDTGRTGIQLRFTITHTNVDVGSSFIFASSAESMLSTDAHAAEADGTTEVVVTFTQEAMHTVTVASTDVNGNAGMSAPFTLDIQTGNWNVTINSPANPSALGVAQDGDVGQMGLQTTVDFTTNAPIGSIATLELNGMAVGSPLVTTGATGSFNVTLPEGDNTVVVLVNNGIKDGQSPVHNVFVDLQPPTVAITQPSTLLRYNVAGDATHLADANPALAGVQASVQATVQHCGTVANPGTLTVSAGAMTLATQGVTADGAQSVTVTLPEGAGQTLRVSCVDRGNNSGEDTRTITVDSVLPGTVTLSTNVPEMTRRSGTVELSFSAPGDDGAMGQLPAGAYALAYRAGGAINTLADFNASTALSGAPATPAAPGSPENVTVSGLKMQQKVFFGLKVTDDEGNVTIISSGEVDLMLKTLADLNGTANTNYGRFINKTTGDVDGDGYDDIVVSANQADPSGLNNAGEVTVYYGDATTPFARSSVLHVPTANVQCSVGGVYILPDLDGDMRDEVAAGCQPFQSLAYVWYGEQGGISSPGPDLVLTDSALSGRLDLGWSMAVLDFNTDGARDLVISAKMDVNNTLAPRVYILFGDGTRRTSTLAAPLDLRGHASVAELVGTATNTGAGTTYDAMGTAVAALRLGIEDSDPMTPAPVDALVVSAPNDGTVATNSGAVYVIAPRAGLEGSTNVAIATLPNTTKLTGLAASWFLGASLGAGDVDGDGDQDLVAAANSGPLAGIRIFLQDGATTTVSSTSHRFLYAGDATAIDQDRTELVVLNDANGDGRADVLASSPGKAHLFLGAAVITDRTAADYTFTIDTGTSRTTLGAGDINGDGYADILIGSTISPGTVKTFY